MFRRDVLLVIGLLLVCGLVAFGAAGLRTSSFEPLGPAAFPLGLAGSIAVLSLLLLAQSWLRRGRDGDLPDLLEGEAVGTLAPRRPLLAVALMVLATGFGVAIAIFRIDFALVGFAFLVVAITMMTGMRLRALPLTLAIAAITAFGSDYLFTQVLVINLP